jgi:molybdopterin-binding protein
MLFGAGALRAAFADPDPLKEMMSWRERVAPTQLVLRISPSQPTFTACDKASFNIAITNRSSEQVTLDLGNVAVYVMDIRDSNGHHVVPTGTSGIINSSIFFVPIASGEMRDLGGIALKELSTPFSATDCPPGTYLAVLHVSAGSGYVVTSNVTRFAVK